MSEGSDVPRVIVFPPLIPLSVVVIGGLLDRSVPLGWLTSIPRAARLASGLVLLVLGVALLGGGLAAMRRIGTNVRPSQPALALVVTGPFAHTRNPLYVGGALALLGIILGFGLDWTLLLLLASFPVLHYGIVLREERYLEQRFGEPYRRYKASVPRYAWGRGPARP
jgi:protein-S-isoprenylcysteine O-methyltransferase Ste14